jgi:hypothetical protein
VVVLVTPARPGSAHQCTCICQPARRRWRWMSATTTTALLSAAPFISRQVAHWAMERFVGGWVGARWVCADSTRDPLNAAPLLSPRPPTHPQRQLSHANKGFEVRSASVGDGGPAAGWRAVAGCASLFALPAETPLSPAVTAHPRAGHPLFPRPTRLAPRAADGPLRGWAWGWRGTKLVERPTAADCARSQARPSAHRVRTPSPPEKATTARAAAAAASQATAGWCCPSFTRTPAAAAGK